MEVETNGTGIQKMVIEGGMFYFHDYFMECPL